MTHLILIDSRIPEVESIIASVTSNTVCLVFDYSIDTFETIQSRITQPYDSIAIAQHKYGMPTFRLVKSMFPATIIHIEECDPELESWGEFIGFLSWLKMNGAKHVDLMACNLWADTNWKYAILKIRELLSLSVRASIDITGKDGNFVLESDNVDMVGIYFTPEISNYKHNFYTTAAPVDSVGWMNYSQVTLPSNNTGTIPFSSYNAVLGYVAGDRYNGQFYANAISAGGVSNVSSVYMTDGAYAVLKTDGTVYAYGDYKYGTNVGNYGGDISAIQSQLTNVVKMASTQHGFAALKSDKTVIAWGMLESPGTYYTVSSNNFIFYRDISNTLVDIDDIVGSCQGVYALTTSGKVIYWGVKLFAPSNSASIAPYLTSDVIKIKTTRDNVVFIKRDGSAYTITSGGGANSLTTAYNTNPIVDACVFNNSMSQYGVYIRTAGTTKQLTNITGSLLYYTMPEGVYVVKHADHTAAGNNYKGLLLLSNNVFLILSINNATPTIITNVSEFEYNEYAYAYLKDGTVYVSGSASYGGDFTNTYYGLPIISGTTRVSLTNVRRLLSTSNSFGAITFDNAFIWWGAVYEPYRDYFWSSPFRTTNAKTIALTNAFSSNVVSAYSCATGYIITKTDRSIISFGSLGLQIGNATTQYGTKNTGKNVMFVPNSLGFIPVDVSPVETSSLSQTQQYISTTVSYYNSNPDVMAIRGRKYKLYNGTTLLSTWYCQADSLTFTFSKVVFTENGALTLTIYDAPDFTTSKLLVGSFSATVTNNPSVSEPDPPVLTSVVVGNKQITVNFTPPDWNGGTEIIGYKYSTNLGVTYTTISSSSRQFIATNIPDASYTIYVKTVSFVGESYEVKSSVQMYTVPSAPVVSAGVIGNQSLTITTNTTSNGGGDLTTFKYKLSTDSVFTNVAITSPSTNSTTFTIPNLLNGSTYSIQICATNGAGNSAITTYGPVSLGKVVPFAPTITSVIVGNTSAKVIFTPPYNGGDPIDLYRYSINNSVSDSGFVTIGLVDSSFTITGLTNGTSYTVKMMSHNSLGNSVESAVSAPFVPKTAPSSPTITNVTVGNQSATVAFSAPASNGGSSITKYRYRLSGGNAVDITGVSLVNSTGSFTISGLTNGTSYTLTMTATTIAGESVLSVVSSAFVPCSTPDTPIITGVSKGDQSASVTFSVNVQGSSLTGLRYSLNDASFVLTSSTTSPLLLTGLSNGTSYSVKIQAVNSVGESPASLGSSAFVPMTIPGAPTITSIEPGNGLITVSFADPEYNGSSSITGYKYAVNDGSFISIGMVQSPYVIRNGIFNGIPYSVVLKAVNEMGVSPASTVSETVIPFTLPDAPIVGAITNGDKTATIALTAGSSGGYPIQSYAYSINDGEPIVITELTTLSFSGLDIGTEYHLKMKSATEKGVSAYATASFIGKSIPDKPVITQIVARNNSSMVYFTPPNANQSPITQYAYSVLDGSFVSVVLFDASSFIINGLTANVEYTVSMNARNAIGTSSNSDTLTVIPYTYPIAPVINNIEVGNGTATIVYTAQSDNSSTITDFQYSINNSSYVSVPEPFVLSDLSNGIPYTLRMKAVNAAGASPSPSSASFMTKTVPESPTIVSVTAGNHSCELEFIPGFFNGSQILKYQYSTNGSDFQDATGTVSPITISGLTNGLTYMIYLRGVNEVGESNISSPSSDFVPFVTQSSPNPPTITSAIAGDECVEVSFDAGINNGSAIKGYLYSDNSGVSYKWAQQTTSPLTIFGLTNGIEYTITLCSVNNSGPSDPSEPSIAFTPCSIPSMPYIHDVNPLDSSVHVSFFESQPNGAQIRKYMYSLNNGTEYAEFYDNTNTIYGLTNGEDYTVRIVAVNDVGTSIPTYQSIPVKPFNVPNAPIINNVESGDHQITVDFTLSEEDKNGSTISFYEYAIISENGSTSQYMIAPGIASPINIVGLTNGESYAILLRAVTTQDVRSASSIPSYDVIPHGVPEKPFISSVIPGNSQLTVHYTSRSNGDSITNVQYLLNDSIIRDIIYEGSPFIITGLVNGTSYDIKMKTVNSAGESEYSNISVNNIPFSTPDPPTIQSVVPGDSKIQVYFTAGNMNGSNFLGYKCSLNDASYVWVNGTESPLQILSLTNGTSYTVRLKSKSEIVGTSEESNMLASVMPYKSPDAPIIQSVAPGDNSATITFVNGSLNGLSILGYKYSLDSVNFSDISYNVVNSKLQIIIPGLTNGTTYSVQLKSTSAVGDSAASALSAQFMPYTNPSKPIIERVVTGNQTASIYIIDGALNGSGVVEAYQYTLDGINYLWASSPTSPIVITTGLVNNQAYRIQVKTKTTLGISPLSTQSSLFTPYTLPSAPTITSVTAGNGVASIYYTDGNTNGRPLTKYQYSLNGGAYTDVAVGSPIQLTGLVNGTSYTVLLKSFNLAGLSNASFASNGFIPYTVPSAPTITNIVASANQATVYVSPGNSNGSAITKYSYSYNGGAYVSTTDATQIFTIPGLTNGTTYYVTVKSENSAGLSAESTTYTDVIPYTMPDAPTITSVSVGNGTATVNITNGNNNGRTITQYQYTYTSGSTSITLTTSTSTSQLSSFIITGLTNWSTYTVTVKAINIAGMSVASATSSSFMPYNIPGAPVISSVVPGNALLTVNMDGLTIGSGVVGYRYSINGSADYTYKSGGGTTFTITDNIVNSLSYIVRVKSVTSLGDTPVSMPYSAVIPFSVPNYPTITSVVPGNRTISIYVTDGSNNGSAITKYEYSDDGVKYNMVDAVSPIVLSNLVNWQSYSFYVRALNSAGASLSSTRSVAVKPFLVPTSASISSVIPGDKQFTVEMNGYTVDSGITGYLYSFDASGYEYIASPAASFVIPNLVNGENYTVYVKSVTEAGNSPASQPSIPTYPRATPSVITNVVVTPLNECAAISFADGAGNGAAIDYYLYSLNGEIDVPIKKRDDGTMRVYGLANATQYSIRMRAVNNAGPSNYSETSNTFVPYGSPRPPVITQIIPGNSCAYVYFAEVDTNGSPLTVFKYSLGGSLLDVSGLSSPLTIPALTNKTLYNISIAACNDGGVSNNSNALQVTPGAPTAPVITNIVPGAKRLLVYFNLPNDNGSAVTQYMVGGSGLAAPTKAISLNTTSVSPLQVINLKNGSPYNLYIYAVNKNGNSVISNTLGEKVPCDFPNKVAITSVTPVMNGAVIYFAAPVDNGAPITKYKYVINSDTVFTDISNTTLPLRITGIPVNTPCTVKVIATNSAGDSGVSIPSKPFSYVYLPPAQVKITSIAMPSKNALTVTFIAPAMNGSAITKYQYALNAGTVFNDISGTTLPLTITENIVPNVSYNVRIIAVNEAGSSEPSLPAVKPVSFEYLPPLSVTITTIVSGNASALVSFTTTPIRKAPITGFSYTSDPAGLVYTDISGAVSPFTITGLTNDTLYNIRIAAITDAGRSAWSLAKPVTPVYKAPDKIVITSVISGNAQLTVNFTPPAQNGSPITEYKYTLNGGVKITAVLATGGKSFIITKNVVDDIDVLLENGKPYSVQVCAMNGIGDSELSLPKPGTPKA